MNESSQFTNLYNEYAPGVLKLCLGYTGDGAMAEDLLQETFVSVWRNMAKFRGDASWSTWIYRIAVNTCLTYLRKHQQKVVDIANPAYEQLQQETCNKEQQVQLLYKCISQLQQTDRLIISLVLEDKPYAEIAAIIDITETNLRVKIHRIKKQLTEIYNTYERF